MIWRFEMQYFNLKKRNKCKGCVYLDVGSNGSNDMNVFKSIGLLIFISIQAVGQNTDSLTSNHWIEKQLNIANITATDMEIDLRIFLNRGITNGGHVLHIMKNNKGWSGTKYDYWLKMNDGYVTEKVKKINKTKLKSNDWDSLWTKLQQFNVLNLPNQASIKDKLRKKVKSNRGDGYEAYEVMIVTDGSSYDLEIKIREKIAKYSFHEPCVYSNKYPEVEEVRSYCNIILTLEKEFQIKFGH